MSQLPRLFGASQPPRNRDLVDWSWALLHNWTVAGGERPCVIATFPKVRGGRPELRLQTYTRVNTMPGVHLRPACAQDLPGIADLAARAMLEDELFAYLCPARYEHYSHFRYAFLRRLKKRLVTPRYVMIVAVENEGSGKSICGYALWNRNGSGADAWQNDTWSHALERMLLAVEDRYLALIYPDRSVDPHRLEQYLASAVDCFPFSDFPQNWFLSTVAVDPAHQRRGIGQQLIEWGIRQGLQDKIPVGLEASLKGLGLYERLGFRTVNELEFIPGIVLRAMVYDTNTLSDDTLQ